MAQRSGISGVKWLLIALGLGFFCYILGPPLYWHFTGDDAVRLSSCPMCVCDQESKYKQLHDEMKLQESVAEDIQKRLEEAKLEAKKAASQYQKEIEKCNSAMETREKAEALLDQEKKISAMWEDRARALGWKEDDNTENLESAKDGDDGKKSEEPASSKKQKPKDRGTAQSRKNNKEIVDLQSNLAVAQYLIQRAVSNEMDNLNVARKHAIELNLL